MNQFETTENIYAYCELANAVIASACNDYRNYNKHFRKNLDLIQYIEARMDELRQVSGEHSDELNDLRLIKNDIKFDQIKLQSKIEEIEIFLLSEYGTMLSYGLGDVILEKIKKEQPIAEPSAERGKILFEKKEKQIRKRLEVLLGVNKK